MDASVYRASLKGSWEALTNIQGWSDQLTYTGDTVLHVHLGTPRQISIPWHRRIMFWKSVHNIEFIKNVLDHNSLGGTQSLLWHENSNGEIPLHVAAKFGHAQAVEEFLRRARLVGSEEVRNMLLKVNKWKDTALHLAARAGYDQIVKLLVEADPRCPQEPNDDNETPLYLAAESESEDSAAAILDISHSSALDYAHQGPCGLTALHVLVQWDTTGILIKKMLDKDKSLVKLQDETGSTPLHWAAANDKVKQLSILLSYDSNTNESAAYIKDNDGQTPLHTAAFYYKLNCIKELVSNRPDCMDVVDSKGQNVLHYAANWACIEKFEYFLRKFDHQHHLKKLFNSRNLAGETPLHLIAANTPQMTCGCKRRVHNFMKVQQQYLKSFNKDNLTVVEIVDSHIHPWEGSPLRLCGYLFGLLEPTEGLAPMCRRMKKNGNSENVRRKTYEKCLEKALADLNKGAKSELIVAALVATVSFTAGFTLPGGFNQNSGMPVLGNSVWFEFFVVTDTFALLLSSFAVLFYFLAATPQTEFLSTVCSLLIAKFLTYASTVTMIPAFGLGLNTVLPDSLSGVVMMLLFSFVVFLAIVACACAFLIHLGYRCRHQVQK